MLRTLTLLVAVAYVAGQSCTQPDKTGDYAPLTFAELEAKNTKWRAFVSYENTYGTDAPNTWSCYQITLDSGAVSVTAWHRGDLAAETVAATRTEGKYVTFETGLRNGMFGAAGDNLNTTAQVYAAYGGKFFVLKTQAVTKWSHCSLFVFTSLTDAELLNYAEPCLMGAAKDQFNVDTPKWKKYCTLV